MLSPLVAVSGQVEKGWAPVIELANWLGVNSWRYSQALLMWERTREETGPRKIHYLCELEDERGDGMLAVQCI